MSQYTKANAFVLRARLIDWAYRAEIAGNRQSVDAARRVLIFICSVVGVTVDAPNYLECWYSVNVIAAELGLKPRRTYDAVSRLRTQKLITVIPVKKSNSRIVVLLDAKFRAKFAMPIAKFASKFAISNAKFTGEFALEEREGNKERKEERADFEYMQSVMEREAPWLLRNR